MTHEELIKEVAHKIEFRLNTFDDREDIENAARAVLALVAKRLKEPTEAMVAAAFAAARYGENAKIHREVAQKQYCAMLAASPLVPPARAK